MTSTSERVVFPQELPIHKVVEPIRVVIADDSTEFLDVLSACLELDHFMEIVGIATNGAEAIQQAADRGPDLVLMDVNMPYLNGFEAALIISKELPDIAIILMSADDSPRLRTEAHACGAHAFIPKWRLTAELVPTAEEARSRLYKPAP